MKRMIRIERHPHSKHQLASVPSVLPLLLLLLLLLQLQLVNAHDDRIKEKERRKKWKPFNTLFFLFVSSAPYSQSK
jgi:hypothetical protein